LEFIEDFADNIFFVMDDAVDINEENTEGAIKTDNPEKLAP
jgi:hypothetical protein